MPSARATETLHGKIYDDLRGRIVDGAWHPGFQLPTETQLASRYGVARMTMNKVLTQLAQEGFLVRRKRSGTFVAEARAQSAVLEINNIAEEVAALGRSYQWTLLSTERRFMSAADLRLFGVRRAAIDEEALFLQGLHYAGGEPFCLETRVINLDAAPAAADTDFHGEVPGTWLLRTMPWSVARHQVRAVNTAGRDATILDLPFGTACLEILRKTAIDDRWITYARLLYPGEAHQLIAEFAPGAG